MSKPLLIFGLTVLIVLSLLTFGAAEGQYMQVRLYLTTPAALLQAQRLKLDVTYVKPGEYIDIVSNPEELNRLRLLGFKTEVIHSDLEKFFASRLDQTKVMGGYHTYNETVAVLDSIHAMHPDITTAKVNIGTTIEGRTIWAMKISDNPEVDEDKPEIFYNGLIHAREPIGIELLLYFMKYLTDNYSTNPEVKDLVDNRELWFVPIINPDGYVYNESQNPNGGGMWRGNRRLNWNGTYGVDLNRNFGYGWGNDDIGSSPNPGDETYRGTAAFSEPETQAIRDFINAHDFVIVVNYHSYSNLYIYPWGYELQYPEDYPIFKEVTDSTSAYNGYLCGPDWTVLWYNTNGDAVDWEYGDWSGKNKIISLITEVGSLDDYFWPPTDRILPLCQENLGPNIYLAKKAGDLRDRPYRFFETQPNFIDTSLVSYDSLVLDLRVYGHQTAGNLSWTVSDPDSFKLPFALDLLSEPSKDKSEKTKGWGLFNSVSTFLPASDWLRIEPKNGVVSPGGYFDHRVVLDATKLPSQCAGKEVSGALVFHVSNGVDYDSIIVPVTFYVGPSKQISSINTGRVRSDITNVTKISGVGNNGWRYLDELYNYLYDGSFFLAYLKDASDTVVNRDLYLTHSFGAASTLNIDLSSPRWQKADFSAADLGCNLMTRGEILAPSNPDSSDLMIYQYLVTNLTPDTIKGLYLGMAVDWDVPDAFDNNYGGYDSTLNLLWQQGPANERYAGITYLSDSSLYGAKIIKNEIHMWPTGSYETGDLYRLISSPGYYLEGSPSDLSSILTAKMLDLGPGDSTKLFFALVSSRTGLESLRENVLKARDFVPESFLQGDANGDKKLNVSDVIYIINYLFKGGPPPNPLESADANCDSKISVTDVIYLINYLFKGGPKPAC
jgi:hypothetical protein